MPGVPCAGRTMGRLAPQALTFRVDDALLQSAQQPVERRVVGYLEGMRLIGLRGNQLQLQFSLGLVKCTSHLPRGAAQGGLADSSSPHGSPCPWRDLSPSTCLSGLPSPLLPLFSLPHLQGQTPVFPPPPGSSPVVSAVIFPHHAQPASWDHLGI